MFTIEKLIPILKLNVYPRLPRTFVVKYNDFILKLIFIYLWIYTFNLCINLMSNACLINKHFIGLGCQKLILILHNNEILVNSSFIMVLYLLFSLAFCVITESYLKYTYILFYCILLHSCQFFTSDNFIKCVFGLCHPGGRYEKPKSVFRYCNLRHNLYYILRLFYVYTREFFLLVDYLEAYFYVKLCIRCFQCYCFATSYLTLFLQANVLIGKNNGCSSFMSIYSRICGISTSMKQENNPSLHNSAILISYFLAYLRININTIISLLVFVPFKGNNNTAFLVIFIENVIEVNNNG